MRGFEWAERNLAVHTPDQLRTRGAKLYHAPRAARNSRLIDLGSGRVEQIREGDRPSGRWYAEFDSLVRYCVRTGIPLAAQDGQVTSVGDRHGASLPKLSVIDGTGIAHAAVRERTRQAA
jgi:hypothetical protein